jgi:hypothetical protein
MEDDSWGTCEIGHLLASSQETLSVTAIRRLTARSGKSAPRTAISHDRARETATNGLVLPGWRAGDEDPFDVVKRVANEEHAWNERAIVFDGQMVTGYEREYRGRWGVYHATASLIVLVAAPVALRPDVVELRRLEPGEFEPVRHVAE